MWLGTIGVIWYMEVSHSLWFLLLLLLLLLWWCNVFQGMVVGFLEEQGELGRVVTPLDEAFVEGLDV